MSQPRPTALDGLRAWTATVGDGRDALPGSHHLRFSRPPGSRALAECHFQCTCGWRSDPMRRVGAQLDTWGDHLFAVGATRQRLGFRLSAEASL